MKKKYINYILKIFNLRDKTFKKYYDNFNFEMIMNAMVNISYYYKYKLYTFIRFLEKLYNLNLFKYNCY